MLAVLCRTPGRDAQLDLAQIAAPQLPLATGQVMLKVVACGVTFPDILLVEGRYQASPTLPFIPGCEFAGVITAMGEGVTGFAVGDRVVATYTLGGGMAEFSVVEARKLSPLPEGMDFATGVALFGNYGTSLHALVSRGGLQKGQTLLVLGASGGVGLAAVELGKALGARVVAAASSAEKLQIAQRHGADVLVEYPPDLAGREAQKALSAGFKAAVGPQGADVIFDAVGGGYAAPALRAIAWEGRYLVIGFAAGIPEIPLNLALLKGCQIVGVIQGAATEANPTRYHQELEQLRELHQQGHIKPLIFKRFPMTDAAAAFDLMRQRQVSGKIILTITND